MFVLNDDLSIYVTRGDIVFFSVKAEQKGETYTFKAGDVMRVKVFGKKNAKNVVLQKDFPIVADCTEVEIFLDEKDTKFGGIINKPTDYWYEVELNPLSDPQTIIGYDEDGPKIFRLLPEGADVPEDEPNVKPEDIPLVDDELDLTSPRPVENQAVARAVVQLRAAFDKTDEMSKNTATALSVERARIDNIIAHNGTKVSKALDYVETLGEAMRAKIDATITSDGVHATIKINLREANLFYSAADLFIIPDECRPIDAGLIHTGDGLEYRIGYDTTNRRYYLYVALTSGVSVAPTGAGVANIVYPLADYEVKDIRVGADGTIYETAGEAVRSQIGPVAKQVKAKNLIDFKKLTRGYFSESGTLASTTTGTYHEVTTDFIPIVPASSYYFAHRFSPISEAIKSGQWQENWFALNLYDANKGFIKRVPYNTLGCVIPGEVFENASYVRVSYRTYMFNRPIFAECSVPCDAVNDECEADNLLDKYPMIFNGYVAWNNGTIIGATIEGDKFVPTAENELTSDFIPCESGEEMFIFATASRENFIRIAFYDANGVFVSAFAYHPTATDNKGASDYDNIFDTFIVPDDAVALRISCRGVYIMECVVAHNDQLRKNLYAECERKHNSKLESEKINSFSIGSSCVNSVAHRGYSTDAPENTLSAYRLAKKKGFACVECDVSFTSDGYAVLLHDASVDRTSDGTGNISDMTLSQARALDFGSWKSAKYAGEKIPTFDEFIVLCKRLGLHPYIELKAGTEEQIKSLVNVVRRAGMNGKITWISFDLKCLEYIKAVDAKARLGYVTYYIDEDIINTSKKLLSGHNEVFIDCSYNGVYSAAAKLCADAEIPLETWTLNDESKILGLDVYISGVTSDSIIASNVIYKACIGE